MYRVDKGRKSIFLLKTVNNPPQKNKNQKKTKKLSITGRSSKRGYTQSALGQQKIPQITLLSRRNWESSEEIRNRQKKAIYDKSTEDRVV